MTRADGDRGSASVWVVSVCALLVVLAFAGTLRTDAVLARHRAEAAADLAALAAAGRIGIGPDSCAAAARIAAANGATIQACAPTLDAGGRSGTVSVRLRLRVRLPVVGTMEVIASARAGRGAQARSSSPSSPSTTSSSRTAPALSRGSLPLPHFGDCTHDGQPVGH